VQVALEGDPVVRGHKEPDAPSIVERVQSVVAGHWSTTGGPTQTHRDAYAAAAAAFGPVLDDLGAVLGGRGKCGAAASAAPPPPCPSPPSSARTVRAPAATRPRDRS